MPSERIQRRIDALLDEADSAFAGRDWARLRDLAGDVLKLDPENADARVFAEAASQGLGEKASSSPENGEAAPTAPSEPLPASFVAGRYAVRRFLGEGGSKKVYLGEDTRLEREVALAVVEGLDLLSMERVRREARAVARLGDHPHIVAIYDTAEDHGKLLTVYQYMAGGDVARLLAEEKQLPTARTLAIAKDVCRALSAIHQAGIVHRDLKPANVFLAADGTARVGDFGLATAHGIDRITQHGTILGTVSYMPPEQALGGDVTAQSDLYSLGCLLYELVTGRPPFVGDDPTAVITQHLNVPPVAPSFLAERCPVSFEKVILQLLEKDPGKRPGSATAVLTSLEAVNPEEASARHSTENPLARLSKGVFVGREKELEKLRTAFDEAFAGHGGLVMLVGEPGIGKTRTTQELETYARMRGATVLWGRTHESSGAPPYWPWVQAGNQWAAQESTNLPLSPDTIGELSRIFPVLRQRPNFVEPRIESDPEAAQFRLFDAYATFLRAMAEQAPLVVALDDLHWADKPTLLLLQHVARELSRSRILVVGNYRDTDITRQSALSESLASLHRESGFERIVLRGLSRDEVASYIRAKANVEPKREVLDRIFEETEGNAFFLSELVNLMAEEGTLSKDSVSDIAIPDGVKEALGRRLNRLSPETNELLQVATIIGREFNYDTLTLLGDRDEDTLLKLIEEAIEARVIEELPQPGRYRFTHAQMQETLLAELSTTRRVRLHGQVGEALEKRWSDRSEQYASRLAEHFVEAAMLSPRHARKAVRYAKLAAEDAERQNGWDEAARWYAEVLTLITAAEDGLDEDEAVLELSLGRCLRDDGRDTEAIRALLRAMALYRERGDGVRMAEAALVAIPLVAFVQSPRTMAEEALAVLGDADPGLRARLLVLGSLWVEDEKAAAAVAEARAIATSLDDPFLEAFLLEREGELTYAGGDFAGAAAIYERAFQAFDRSGDAVGAARALFLTNSMTTWSGDLGRTDSLLADLESYADRHHLGQVRLFVRVERAVILLARRQLSAFEEALDGIGESATRTWLRQLRFECEADKPPDPALLEAVRGSPWFAEVESRARIAYRAGDLTTAAEETRRALEQARAQRSRTAYYWLLRPVGELDECLPALARSEEVRDLYGELCRYSGARASHWSLRSIDRLRGALALRLGLLAEAERWFGLGQEWAERERIPVEKGRCHQGLAEVAASRGETARAMEHLDRAGEIFREHGATHFLNHVIGKKVELQGITSDDMRSSIVAVNAAVQSEHPDLRQQAAPDGTVTLLFSDIESSTPLNERLGDAKWMELLRAHNALIEAQVKAHRGYVVKTMGDGYMVAFKSAADGLRCAIAIQDEFSVLRPQPSVLSAVRVRIGLHTGEMVREGDDFFGRHVTLAARVASLAAGGEILVSGIVHELVAGQGFTCDGGRETELKGLAGTHRVYRVVGT